MPSVNIGGTSIEYLECGSGEPVVLVHGSASDYRTWNLQLEAFGKQYRTISYSRRYHWPNRPIAGDADYSMMEHSEDLRALLVALGAAPAHIVAHSYGALLALMLAIREPRLVKKLVLAEAPVITLLAGVPPKPREILRLLVTRPRDAAAILGFAARVLIPATAAARRNDTKKLMDVSGNGTLGRDSYRRLTESRREQVRANLIRAEFLGSGFLPLDAGEVARIAAPTMLISGERSPQLFHRLTHRLQELLPNAERAVIAGASHILHEDNAPAFNAAVLSFLKKH